MTAYKASNGMVVERDHNGDVVIDRQTTHVSLFMADGTALALREFFQAERDAELGRWRWPENRDYVVYPNGEYARVVREWEGTSESFLRQDVAQEGTWNPYRAARAYFEAHPEPKKPWEDAKQGEVWALKFGDQSEDSWFVNKDWFQNTRTLTCILLADKSITAGRRIYPTEATE